MPTEHDHEEEACMNTDAIFDDIADLCEKHGIEKSLFIFKCPNCGTPYNIPYFAYSSDQELNDFIGATSKFCEQFSLDNDDLWWKAEIMEDENNAVDEQIQKTIEKRKDEDRKAKNN